MAMEKTTSTERHIQSNLQNKTGNTWKRDNSRVSVYYCIEMFTQIQLQNIQA